SATKGAVKIFTQALSREVANRNITVNNVQPGPIDTELNPATSDWAAPQKAATALNRFGHVDEIAAMVAFVAGPESSYITGANLTVDGGMNAGFKRRTAMRAMRAETFSGYQGLKLIELPKPAVTNGKVLVRITAAGVTPLDHTILSGKFHASKAPLILGNEGAGVVEQGGGTDFPV